MRDGAVRAADAQGASMDADTRSLGRTDYILEFPAVRSFFEHDLDIHPELANIRIEGITPYNVTYVTCVKNEWGKRIIKKVDDILKRYIHTPAHREATLRWYQSAEQSELAKYYQRILVEPLRAEKPPRKPEPGQRHSLYRVK